MCVRCGNKPLTAADLLDLFVVDCHGETGSNARLQSEEATMFLECFVVDCEGKSTFSSIAKYMRHTRALASNALQRYGNAILRNCNAIFDFQITLF